MDCRPSKRWSLLAAPLLALAAVSGIACGPPDQPKTASAARQLPPYIGEATTLFDDSIAPGVFGTAVDAADAASDPELPRWTTQSETVVPVRVSTVTCDSQGDKPTYTLMLQPAGPPLAGRALGQPVGVEIGPENPSYAFVHSADSTLVGKEFILFFRHFDEEGRITLHWRAEADTPALRAAIQRARLVGGFGS